MSKSPGGRLSLQQSIPVMMGSVQNASTIWYMPYRDDYIRVNGVDRAIPPGGLSLVLDGNSSHNNFHSPGAVFDLFVFDVGGVLKLGTTHSWWGNPPGVAQSRTGGYGGYTDVVRNGEGLKVNQGGAGGTYMVARYGDGANDEINVPDGEAQYVGTAYMIGTAQVSWVIRNGPSNPGIMAELGLYNEYNKVLMSGHMQLNVGAFDWTLNGSYGGWRPAAGNTAFRVSWVDGSGENTVIAEYKANVIGHGFVGVAFDSTTTPSGGICATSDTGTRSQISGRDEAQSLGRHFFQALEAAEGTWDSWPTNQNLTTGADGQTTLHYTLMG